MAAFSEANSETETEDIAKWIFKGINILTVPAQSAAVIAEDSSTEFLDSVLLKILDDLHQFLNNSPEVHNKIGSTISFVLGNNRPSFCGVPTVPVRIKFVETCICLLQCLTDYMEQVTLRIKESPIKSVTDTISERVKEVQQNVPSLSADVLSLQQEKELSTVLEFLVVLGIQPFLNSGVGIPISRRLGPGKILLATSYDYSAELSSLERIQQLIPVVKLLCAMMTVPSFKDLILARYFSDLLAALLQIRYCCRVVVDRAKKTVASSASCGSSRSQATVSDQDTQGGQSRTGLCDVQIPTEVSLLTQSSEVFVCGELPGIYLDMNGQAWTFQSLIDFCSQQVDRVIRSAPVPHVLTQLIVLSGGTKTSDGPPQVIPAWFRRIVAGILRDVIMVSPGVHHLISLCVGENGTRESSIQEWQKYKAVAHIISQCPLNQGNLKSFYSSISEQLMELIRSPDPKFNAHLIRAASVTIQELTKQQRDLMQDVCISPMLSPLFKLSSEKVDRESLKSGQVLVSEEELALCLVCLHRIFVEGGEPQSGFVSLLQKVAWILFSVYTFARKSVTLIKNESFGLIKAYLNQCDNSMAVSVLLSFASGKNHQDGSSIHTNVVLKPGPSGGLEAVFLKDRLLDIGAWSESSEGVVDVLSSLNSDTLTSQLFLCLLQKLTDIVKSETTEPDIVLPARFLSKKDRAGKLDELREKITFITLLGLMGEKFGAQVIQSAYHVLVFVKATLERCLNICSNTQDVVTVTFEWDTVSMALGLLTAVLNEHLQMSDEIKSILDDLLPLLTSIAEFPEADAAMKEMAFSLKVAAATRGHVWSDHSQSRSQKLRETTKSDSKKLQLGKRDKPLIEVLSESPIHEAPDTISLSTDLQDTSLNDNERTAADSSSLLTKIGQALGDTCDSSIPVKGHGLISLTRLIEDRNPEIKGKQDVLFKIFLENMTHQDSYVYLAAVNGLSALSDHCPDLVIPRLVSEFKSLCTGSQSYKFEEVVLKVGEALVKGTKRLGEMVPKYRDQLLPGLLCGCRHKNPLVRASSLSGLADVCQLLRYSVGPILQELITCCQDIIKSDPDPEPRKAALLTLTLLIRGLDKDVLTALGESMLNVYRVLKHSFSCDPDEKVRVGANLALAELDDIMRNILFAKPEMKKTISILGYQ